MSAGYEVNIRGLAAMQRALRLLNPAFARALRAGHLEIAQTIVAPIARTQAPRGPTGRTRADVRGLATQRAARVASGRSSLVYVPVIHWGWPRRNIARNPWLQRAGQLARPRVAAAYERVVSRSLQQAGLR